MKYLITDLNIKLDGHKLGFVQNLLDYVSVHKTQDQFTFLVNSSHEFSLVSKVKHVQVQTLNSEETQKIASAKNLIEKSRFEWAVISKYGLQVDKVILMEFDLYQIEVGKSASAFKIAGIWFRPFSRMQPESHSLKHRFLHWKSIFQKRTLLKLALRNPNLEKVFILNDEKMPTWLNVKGENRFYTLPDPYFEYDTLPEFNLRERYQIPKENLILLQFGYMDERKNNENIIAALNALGSSPITLLIIGKFKPGYEEELQSLKKGDYQLITRNAFISNEEMESTFAQSDVILRMNVGFFGSSGIVGIAAHHHKPVIVSDTGVMAELVEKYQMGITLPPHDIQGLKKIFEDWVSGKVSLKINGEAYQQSHDLKAFAETLLS